MTAAGGPKAAAGAPAGGGNAAGATAVGATAAGASAAGRAPSFVDIDWAGDRVRIEHAFVGAADDPAAPLWVFLHEGLGSLSAWRDFPARLCAATGTRGLVWSRPGYGRSTTPGPGVPWRPDFLHRQAHEVLPALLQALGIDGDGPSGRPWLFGHSDGGSIALLYAARFPQALAGAVVLAPHILVEERSVQGIEQARTAYLDGALRERLSAHHDDPDGAFWGWNRVWLSPEFRQWSIEAELVTIAAPLLAVQGLDDAYGTLEQIRGIRRRLPGTRLLELERCGHAPHRDRPDELVRATRDFLHTHLPLHAFPGETPP